MSIKAEDARRKRLNAAFSMTMTPDIQVGACHYDSRILVSFRRMVTTAEERTNMYPSYTGTCLIDFIIKGDMPARLASWRAFVFGATAVPKPDQPGPPNGGPKLVLGRVRPEKSDRGGA